MSIVPNRFFFMPNMWPVPDLCAIALLAAGRIYRCWTFGAGLILLLFFISAMLANTTTAGQGGAFNLYREDVVFGTLALAGAVRLAVEEGLQKRHIPWLLFGLATLVSFVIGSALYGVRPAGVEYRPFFYVVAGGFYFATFRFDSGELKKFVSLWLWAAGALMALAWFRWIAVFLQLGISSQWVGIGGENAIRVLNANQTLFLAQAFLVTIYLRRYTTARWAATCFSGALLFTVLLLQHRSVWVVTALCCGMIAWHERACRKLAVGMLAGAMVCLPLYFLVSNYAATVAESLRSSAKEPFDPDNSTIAWRTQLWQEYIFEFLALSGGQTWFGTGYGNSATYLIDGYEVSNSAHNYYVFTLNRAGAIGLILLLCSYGMLLFRVRGVAGSWDYLGLFGALIAGQLLYFMVYMPSYEQGLIAGVVLGIHTLPLPNATVAL